MKRFFRMMMLVVAATMAFAACSQYEDENIAGPTVKVNVAMVLDATRSSFGTPNGTSYPTVWDGDEEMKYSLNFGAAKDVTPTFTDEQSATAELTLTDDSSGAYTIHVLSPVAAFVSVSADYKNWNVNVLTTQNPSATSCDPAAQVLCGVSNTSETIDGSYTISFHHALAYGKMTLENLALNGAKISSVAITTDSDIAGRHYVYPLEKGKTTVNSGAKSITLITDSYKDIWFACAPVKFNSLKVTVTTDKGVFTKQISASKTFTAGKVAVFTIDMAGVEAEKPAEYQLLTDVADLNIGDQVIIANTENQQAISSTQNGNNRGQAGVTINNDCIVAPGEGVEIFVVEEGTKDNTYAFLATKTEGYIYAASSGSNHLKTEETLSGNSSFAITISNGTTSIVAQGTNTRNTLQYNSSSSIFSCYSSASQKPVDIYYLPSGNAPATPSIKASNIEGVPAEGVTNATATVSVKNIDGNVTVTKDGTVVTAASLSGNTLTYTVSANTGEAREGWIKLAATGAECTIKVSQLGAASTHSLPYEESFGSSQGEFTIDNVNIGTLSYVWQWDSSYGMKASAYVGGTKHVTESWLVSPKITLEGATNPELTFDHVQRYAGTASAELTVWVSANNGAWEQVTVPTYSTGSNWNFVSSGKISLSKYIGSVVKIGFKYTSSASVAATWEIKNFSVVDGGETPAPVQLTMSNVTCSAQTENSLTFSWEAVANATGYKVSTDGGSTYGATQTATTYTWTGLSASTTKTIYVKAIGNGSTYTDSTAKSASGTTSAAQGGGEGGSSVFILTGENMSAMTNSGTGYNTEKTYTDGTYTWVTNGYQDGTTKNMIQLRVRTNNSGVSWIKLPNFPAPIKDIKCSVTSASAKSEGADQTSNRLYYQATNAKDADYESFGGTATNEIVMDLSGFSYTTGYITANGGIRIWNITVTLQGEGGGETPAPVQLTMSNVTCSAQTENSLTFSWSTVPNATGYKVSTDGGSTYGATQTATTYTWTGLSASTTKTIYVKAIGNGSTYTDSTAKSAEGTTSAAQGGGNDSANSITLDFTSISKNVSNYTSTWEQSCNSYKWSLTNFNNNGGQWKYVKCGRKDYASVANISTTFSIPWAVASVTVTVDAVTTSKVNSTYLEVATDASFSNIVETVNVTIAKGDLAYNITNPGANYYYRLVYDCASHTSNGIIQISKVVYSAQ